MGFIRDALEYNEQVIYEAHVHWIAHVLAIVSLTALMSPTGLSRSMTTRLALTNRRIIGKTGLIWRSDIEMAYADLHTARLHRGVLGSLFGYGTVTLVKNDGTKRVFRGIAKPRQLKDRINAEVEMAVLGRRLVLPSDEELSEEELASLNPAGKEPQEETTPVKEKPPVQW